MNFKTLEIRDSGTFIPALAIEMCADNGVQDYYIHYRAGYPSDGSSIMLMMLSDGRATNDPWEWESLRAGPRTMPVAHQWILDHFSELSDGDVVDVEFILGETKEPKTSERVMHFRRGSLSEYNPGEVPVEGSSLEYKLGSSIEG